MEPQQDNKFELSAEPRQEIGANSYSAAKTDNTSNTNPIDKLTAYNKDTSTVPASNIETQPQTQIETQETKNDLPPITPVKVTYELKQENNCDIYIRFHIKEPAQTSRWRLFDYTSTFDTLQKKAAEETGLTPKDFWSQCVNAAAEVECNEQKYGFPTTDRFEQDLLKFVAAEDKEQIFLDDIHREVSCYDDRVILPAFYTAISSYGEALNLAVIAPPSAGKTFGVTKAAKYLPKGDVLELAQLSPKAIFRMNGQFVDEATLEPILKPVPVDDDERLSREFKKRLEEYNDKLRNAAILMDWTGKTIILTDSTSPETLEALKPLLSHDSEDKITKSMIVDKSTNRTSTLIIKGHPSWIFCSTDKFYNEEFATRCITTSPVVTPEKI
jgi:hypothetical protein